MTNDMDAQWELHRSYRTAPHHPAPVDYQERMERAGQSRGWTSWGGGGPDRFKDATRRWETGPYGADRPKRGGRGGRGGRW